MPFSRGSRCAPHLCTPPHHLVAICMHPILGTITNNTRVNLPHESLWTETLVSVAETAFAGAQSCQGGRHLVQPADPASTCT